MPSIRSDRVQGDDDQRRRNVRRLAIGLALVALAFYVGFILLGVYRSHAGN
jgi:uncharacterized membrane protein (DUF485 family)